MQKVLLTTAVALGAFVASYVMIPPSAHASATTGGVGATTPAATATTAAPIS